MGKLFKFLMLIIPFGIIILLIAFLLGFRLGDFAGLGVKEWVTIWSGLIIPILLFSAPGTSLYLKYREMSRQEEQRIKEEEINDRNDDWEKWIEIYKISLTDKDAAQRLVDVHQDFKKGKKWTEAQKSLIYYIKGIDLNDPEMSDRFNDESGGPEGDKSQANDRSSENGQIVRSSEDLLSGADALAIADLRRHIGQSVKAHRVDRLVNFLISSGITPVVQKATIERSYTSFTLVAGGVRVGVNYSSSKTISFKFGLGIKGVDNIYDFLVEEIYDKGFKPELKSATNSEGYLREPVSFELENLEDETFFDNSVLLVRVLQSIKSGENKKIIENIKVGSDGNGDSKDSWREELKDIVKIFK